MSASDNLNPRLFEPENPRLLDVTQALNRHDVYWHSSNESRLSPHEDEWRHEVPNSKPSSVLTGETGFDAGRPHPLGLHVGTAAAAASRVEYDERGYAHPLYVSGSYARPEHPNPSTEDRHTWTDDNANGLDPSATQAVREGKNVLYYNETEDAGNVSVRAPRQNLHTWAEHVRLYPHEHTHAERQAAKGGADLVYRTKGALVPSTAPPGLTATEQYAGYYDRFTPEWRAAARPPKPNWRQPEQQAFPGMEPPAPANAATRKGQM